MSGILTPGDMAEVIADRLQVFIVPGKGVQVPREVIQQAHTKRRPAQVKVLVNGEVFNIRVTKQR